MPTRFLVKSRHQTIFHFRRRVPRDLQPFVKKSHLTKSLQTDSHRLAVIRARAAAAQTDALFAHLRAMPKNDKDTDGYTFDYTLTYEGILPGQKRAVARDVILGEEVSAAIAVATLQAHLDGVSVPAPLQLSATEKITGKTIVETWNDFKTDKIAANSWKNGEDTALYDYWPHVRAFVDLIGDKPINAVTADDVIRFRRHVVSAEKGGSASNRKQRLTRAGGLFRWAKEEARLITDDFHELFRYPSKIEKNPYYKFEQADLIALFETDDYRNRQFKTPSEYWLPVLALFTGARLNELCQLTASDIGKREGVDTINILDDEAGKRLKTAASRRIVPIHSKLIELGFLEFVAKVSAGRLFPELPEDPARPGSYMAKATETFTNYRRKCGVGGMKGRGNKTFHSFRSTLIVALRKANVPKDRRTRLAGHEYDDTQDTSYTGGDILNMFDFTTLKEDMELVSFDIRFTAYRQTS